MSEHQERFDYYLQNLERLTKDQKQILNHKMQTLDEQIIYETFLLEYAPLHK